MAGSRIPICHVQLLPLMSGVQRVSLQILDAIDRERFEPHVVCCGPGPFSDELLNRGVQCHFISNLVRPIHPWRDFRAFRNLVELFRRERFQIVHTHCSKPGVLGRFAARKAGTPFIVHHVHCFAFNEFSSKPEKALYSFCEKVAAPFGDHMLFCNNEDRDLAIQCGFTTLEASSLAYNGTDLQKYHPSLRSKHAGAVRELLKVSPSAPIIYFAARLEKQKQPLILPEIAAELQRRLPEAEWRMVIAGEGSYSQRVQGRFEELGLGHRVTFPGWISEEQNRRFLAAADVLLQPSLWEGLSLTLVEAQAAGIPIVASNVKGNRETVVDGTGYLCKATDSAEYAEQLCRLICNPDLRTRLGIAARRRAEALFDVEVNSRRISALYERVTSANDSPASVRRIAA